MPFISNGANARAGVRRRCHPRRITAALNRFPEPARTRVGAVAQQHPALAELALTFPALLVAIAIPAGWQKEQRSAAAGLVIGGAPLRAAARLIGVPGWTRRLPAEAFAGALPRLPHSEAFACRIANALPRPTHMARWLAFVAAAYAAGDEPFTLWAVRHCLAAAPRLKLRQLHLLTERSDINTLALFAFFSRAAGTPANALIERGWSPAMSVEAARQSAAAWLERIDIELHRDAARVADPWLEPMCVEGIDFVPLDGPEAIAEEARSMEHCVMSYARDVAQGRCRLWSLRRHGMRLATLEIRGVGRDVRRPLIGQLQGPQNHDVGEDVWRAAHSWLAAQKTLACAPVSDCAADARVWRQLWMPYWRQHGFAEWLPLSPHQNGVWHLSRWL